MVDIDMREILIMKTDMDFLTSLRSSFRREYTSLPFGTE